jgi:hypothetical protein
MENEKYFENYLIQKEELKSGQLVFLNIYHISKVNCFLKLFGLGLYHTSLEIDDIEYSFGSIEDDKITGITANYKNESDLKLDLKGKKKFKIKKN